MARDPFKHRPAFEAAAIAAGAETIVAFGIIAAIFAVVFKVWP